MIEAVVNFLLAHTEVGYIIVFIVTFFESVAFAGIFVPGTAVVLFSGFMAEQWPDYYDASGLIVIAALGCFLGASTSYLIGRFYGPPFFSENNFYFKRKYLIRAQQYFAAHGGKSIFSGNFLGPVRSLVPFVAGMSEMVLWRFVFWSVSSSVAWASLYVGIGYFFGASWEAVELWGTRLTIFLLGLTIVIILNWLIGRFLIKHERQIRLFFASIGNSVIKGLAENEYIADFIQKHPRFCQFVRKRFSPYEVLGLSFSISVILSFVILGYLLALIHAVVAEGPLIELDRRLLGLVLFIRDPFLSKVMLFVTHLAGLPILGFSAVLSVFLLLRRYWSRAVVFVFGFSSASIVHIFLKWFFDRPRPNVGQALLPVSSASFPSGHAVAAVIFYGFLAYIVLGYIRGWRAKIIVFSAAFFAILFMGFSRIYLGVHWPSDVLGGYLLGAWWLVIMLTSIYIFEHYSGAGFTAPLPWPIMSMKTALIAITLIASLLYYFVYASTRPLETVSVGEVEIFKREVIKDLHLTELSHLNRATETVRGRPQTPINVIIIGSRAALESAFRAAGWEIADPATLRNILGTIRSSLANTAYPTAPISPSFYEGRAQDIGVEKETALQSARQRHHARFWLAPIVLADGRNIWFGTASFDSGVAYSSTLKFPTHLISPDIDKERDYLYFDLLSANESMRGEIVDFNEPAVGLSGVGAPFFTDGQARLMWLND